jgi:hypothetical protein
LKQKQQAEPQVGDGNADERVRLNLELSTVVAIPYRSAETQ